MSSGDDAVDEFIDHRLAPVQDVFIRDHARFAHRHAETGWRCTTRPTRDGDLEIVTVQFYGAGTDNQITACPTDFRQGELFLHRHPTAGMPELSKADDESAARFAALGVGFGVVDEGYRRLAIARLPDWEQGPPAMSAMRIILKLGRYRLGWWHYTT